MNNILCKLKLLVDLINTINRCHSFFIITLSRSAKSGKEHRKEFKLLTKSMNYLLITYSSWYLF